LDCPASVVDEAKDCHGQDDIEGLVSEREPARVGLFEANVHIGLARAAFSASSMASERSTAVTSAPLLAATSVFG
jgi:hypothetical protein